MPTPSSPHICLSPSPGWHGAGCQGESSDGACLDRFPLPPTYVSAAPFPRGERIICFSCCPDLWATLFFIYLHKLSKVTHSFPEVRDSVNTLGSQVSRPAQGRRGYRRSPGNGRQTAVLLRCRGSAVGLMRRKERPACTASALHQVLSSILPSHRNDGPDVSTLESPLYWKWGPRLADMGWHTLHDTKRGPHRGLLTASPSAPPRPTGQG